jgi:hypothetical protein
MKPETRKADVIIEVKNQRTHTTNMFHFSRFQFESLLILWPASVVAGFMATGILVYDYTLVRPNLMKQNAGSPSRSERQMPNITSVTTEEEPKKLAIEASPELSSQAALDTMSLDSGSQTLEGDSGSALSNGVSSPEGANQEGLSNETMVQAPQSQNSEINQVADRSTLNTETSTSQNNATNDQPSKLASALPVEDAAVSPVASQAVGPVVSPAIKEVSSTTVEVEAAKAQQLMDESIAKQVETTPTSLTEAKAKVSSTKEAEHILVSKDFQVEDLYSVHVEINQKSVSKELTALLSMKNLTGRTERGRVWIKILVSNGATEKWLSSHVNLETDSEMRALNSNVGKLYEFSYLFERMLTFGAQPTKSIEIKEIVLGTSTERHGQKVSRYKVSSANQSL